MRMGFDYLHSRGMSDFNQFSRVQVLQVNAAGSAQGDAAAITAECIVWALGADATKGVILPAPSGKGARILVINDKTANAVLKVYPATGGKINGGSANASLNMAAKTSAWFVSLDGTNWDTLPLLPS